MAPLLIMTLGLGLLSCATGPMSLLLPKKMNAHRMLKFSRLVNRQPRAHAYVLHCVIQTINGT